MSRQGGQTSGRPRAGGRPRKRRAAQLRVVAAVTSLALVSGGALVWQGTHRRIPLYQEGVVRDVSGELVAVPPGWTARGWLPLDDDPGRRAVELSLLTSRAAADQLWLASGWTPPADHPHAAMARAALRDLHTLTGPEGVVVAGASPAWRFVWPRDASFVAVALARTGHDADALAVLHHLQGLQAADGSMQARYLPDGSGAVPDDRLPQEDGPGWALWAAREVLAQAPAKGMPSARAAAAAALTPLITRSAARLLEQVDPATGLPQPSPDYWERPEGTVTLGIAATSLMGLQAAAALAEEGLVPAAAWAQAGVDPAELAPAAVALEARIVQDFGPRFPRHVGGRPDAAVTFLLPPFVDRPVPGAELARRGAIGAQRRAAGGVAPGAGWRQDGVSWTPQTALQALAATAAGREEEAQEWLDWLDAHRTATGALPEKVLHDGRPAAVAPLGWTAALVLIALTQDTG